MNFPTQRSDRRRRTTGDAASKTEALVYLRVSTKDQLDNFSIETQREECRRHCQRQGWTVMHEYQEAASAKTAERPQFQALLEHCRRLKSRVVAVVVYSVNRFSRDAGDCATTSRHLRELGIRLCSVTEPFDNLTPAGKMMENMLSSFAQFDNEMRGDRTKTGMRAAVKSGKWVNAPPIGYVSDRTSPGGLALDSERAPLIRAAFEFYSEGYTKTEIRTKLTASGLTMPRSGKAISPQMVDKLLRSPVYAGWITGSWVPERGAFAPIISEDLRLAVQARMESKPSPNPQPTRSLRRDDFPLRVFLKCGKCHKGITGSFATGRGQKKYPHYSCRTSGCRAVKFRRDDLHQHFIEFLHSLSPKPGLMDLFRAVVGDVWKQRNAEQERASHVKAKARAALEARQERLLELLIEKGIEQGEYDNQKRRVGTALAELETDATAGNTSENELASLLEFGEWLLHRVGHLVCCRTEQQNTASGGAIPVRP